MISDASLVIKLALHEEASDEALQLWRAWQEQDVSVSAPSLLWYEIASSLANKVHRSLVTADQASTAFERLAGLPIVIRSSPNLHLEAMQLAIRLGLSKAYDAHYLVLAQHLDAEFWTADERLFNSVKDGFPLIRLLAAV